MNIVERRIAGFFAYASVFGLRQTFLLYLRRITTGGEIRLTVQGVPTRVTCRPSGPDFYTLRHVFVDRDCDAPIAVTPRLIIDGGANIGYASVLFASKYPGAKIIAVEPDGKNCDRFRQNCAAFPNIRLVQGGVWSRHTHLRIRNPSAEPWMFEVEETGDPAPGSIEGFTIEELLAQSGEETIDILKLDIEGSETAVFTASDTGWMDRTRVMSIEVHGEEADRAVRAAAASRDFDAATVGEKVIFTNRHLEKSAKCVCKNS